MHGEPSAETDPGHPPGKEVGRSVGVRRSDLKARLRDDTKVLLRTIQASIDLLQQARSASATPALGQAYVFLLMFSPIQGDVNAEMEEVSKQLKPFSLPASALSTPAPSSGHQTLFPPSPLLTSQAAQVKMIEVAVVRCVNGRERRR